MDGPTIYAELNDVLRELVASVQTVLAENFCGAYLQGSFAVGDADEHSDVDFIAVTHNDLSAEQVAALQGMHQRIYALATPWAQHLEGSYVPKDALRYVDATRSEYLYLDNGATELVWDNHCDTAVVRWSLREYGITLAGPDPKSLVEPVSAEQLRSEIRTTMREWVDWAKRPDMNRWRQPYLVCSYCRMLHTLITGRVGSKREAGEWALGALDPEWASLIQRALDDRPDPARRARQPADPEAIDRTRAFVDYALDEAAKLRSELLR